MIYWLSYYLYYKLSGAHRKPASDSKYDPEIAHNNHFLCKLIRKQEEKLYSGLRHTQTAKLKLPTIEAQDINPELFQFLSRKKTTPVVLRGLIKDSEAVSNWSAEYFSEKYGDISVLTLRKPEDMQGTAYTSFNRALDFKNLVLRDSIESMCNGKETLYINNITQIFYNNPELVDQLDLDNIQRVSPGVDSKNWLKINMFMGGPGTGSSLHCAVGGNFFFNVHGRKKWILIDPKYSRFLKSTPSKEFEFVISGHDIENPSEILQKIPKYEVILEPGDVLFVAPWWWHQVTNITDFTIGCSVRDHSVYWPSFKNNPMYMLMSPYPLNLNPWALKLAEKIKGRDYLLNRSMASEDDIVHNLTNYTK